MPLAQLWQQWLCESLWLRESTKSENWHLKKMRSVVHHSWTTVTFEIQKLFSIHEHFRIPSLSQGIEWLRTRWYFQGYWGSYLCMGGTGSEQRDCSPSKTGWRLGEMWYYIRQLRGIWWKHMASARYSWDGWFALSFWWKNQMNSRRLLRIT